MWYSPRMRITTTFLALVLLAGGCSSSSNTDGGVDGATEDAGVPRDPNKNCVKPGTPNNELGVGGYCDLKDDADCRVVADKLLQALAPEFRAGGRRLKLAVSVGISLFPSDGGDGDRKSVV